MSKIIKSLTNKDIKTAKPKEKLWALDFTQILEMNFEKKL